jgi:hypothetical protein
VFKLNKGKTSEFETRILQFNLWLPLIRISDVTENPSLSIYSPLLKMIVDASGSLHARTIDLHPFVIFIPHGLVVIDDLLSA